MVIARLSELVIGQIAAGEVIERPVSVIKELVENALDAGATRIVVSLQGGGVEEIEVVDNGSGIDALDLPLAIQRHATSKLRDPADLEALKTLGFRGEGLASIAAVARLALTSRRAGDDFAARIEAFETWSSEVQHAAGPVGTSVVARDLFGNVPVRREYLRSAQAETTRISTFLSTLALGYPQVAFTLRVDGRELFTYPPTEARLERLAHLFGREVFARMIPLEEISTGMHGLIHGFISRPGFDRGDRRMQMLFVNGRLLRSTQLGGAWSGGYAGYTMTGRHPYGVVFLDIPPDHVDPNVHPTKSDVRFRFGTQVIGAVRSAIVTTLHRDATRRLGSAISLGPQTHPHREADRSEFDPSAVFHASDSWQNMRRLSNATSETTIFDSEPVEEDADVVVRRTTNLRVLAQLDHAFILATDDRAIVVIDQHAAHERVAYEEIVIASKANAVSQPLLVPDLIELDRADALKLDETLEALQAIGVEIEPFGERTYRLSALPALLSDRHFDLRGYLDDLDDKTPGLDAREHVWATMACHSVVRAGEAMHVDEMQSVINRLAECENPMHCPHGRPTIVRLDAPAIAKLFKRV